MIPYLFRNGTSFGPSSIRSCCREKANLIRAIREGKRGREWGGRRARISRKGTEPLGVFHIWRPQIFLIFGPPPPSEFPQPRSFCLLCGDPLPLPLRTSDMEAPCSYRTSFRPRNIVVLVANWDRTRLGFFFKVKRLLNFMLVICLRPLRQGKVAQSTQTLSPKLSTAPPSLDRTLRIWIALNGRKPIPACTLTEAGSICSPSPRGEGVKAKENFYCRCKRLLFPLPLCLPQLMKFSLPHAPQCFRLSASLFTRVQVDKVAE